MTSVNQIDRNSLKKRGFLAMSNPGTRPAVRRALAGRVAWCRRSLSPLLGGEGRGCGALSRREICRRQRLAEAPPHPDLLPLKGEKEHKRRARLRLQHRAAGALSPALRHLVL